MNEGVDVNRGQYEVEPEILNKVLEMNEEANSKKEELRAMRRKAFQAGVATVTLVESCHNGQVL